MADQWEEYDDFDYDESEDDWCEVCQGLGTVECYCGGDQCYCLNNGERDCPACSR